jgi:hypothetical protein
MRQMVVAISVFVVAQLAFLVLGLQIVNAPVLYGSWPSGVTESGLRASVRSAFQSCLSSRDSQPGGCPQAAPAISGPVSWSLAGDPLQHAGFEMIGRTGDSRTFQVWGAFAMLAASGGQIASSQGPFIATVVWNGRALVPGDIRRGGFSVDRPPEATDQAARAAAAAAFAHCAGSPDAARCAVGGGAPTALAPSDSWTRQAQVGYDSGTGVLHVRGHLSTGSVQAAYDASEAVGPGGSLICYRITYAPGQ